MPATVRVEQGVLTLQGQDGAHQIVVGSPAWFAWLESATVFAFVSVHGAFTARRERAGSGRGTWYWRAYAHQAGGRRRAYLGRAEEVNLERLHAVAALLAEPRASALTQEQADRGASARRGPDGGRPVAAAPVPLLLATKLYLPRVRPDLVLRPHLFARLDEGLNGSLTLVCAPAGFGKTTLVATWVRHTGRPTAWLALDSGDNDLVVFLRYLVAALQSLAPQVGAGLAGLLQSPPPPLETLLTALLNDLTGLPPDSILVLDDHHVLEAPPIHQAVGFLLDHSLGS